MNSKLLAVCAFSFSTLPFSTLSPAAPAPPPPQSIVIGGQNYSSTEREGVHQVVLQSHSGIAKPTNASFTARCTEVFTDLERFRFLIERCSSSGRPEAACRNLGSSVLPTLWGITLPRERIPQGVAQQWTMEPLHQAEHNPELHRAIADALNVHEKDVELLVMKKASLSQATVQIDANPTSLLAMLKENPYNIKPVGQASVSESGTIVTQDLLTACSLLKGEAKFRVSTSASFSPEYAAQFGRNEFWALFSFLKKKIDPAHLSQRETGVLAGYHAAQFLNKAKITLPPKAATVAVLASFDSPQSSEHLVFKDYETLDDIPGEWELELPDLEMKTTMILNAMEAHRD